MTTTPESLSEPTGGFFCCDACGYVAMSVQNLEEQSHLEKKHASIEDLEDWIMSGVIEEQGGDYFDRLRERAQEGRLATMNKCGVFKRFTPPKGHDTG